jgi:hypothetical protein
VSSTLREIQALVAAGDVEVSAHGAEELDNDNISLREVLAGVQSAVVVEDYPTFAKGPCVLVLQHDAAGGPIHILWGLLRGTVRPAVLITAYRPDPNRWSGDFLTRRP